MRALLFAVIAAAILLAGCAGVPVQQKQAPSPEPSQLQAQQPSLAQPQEQEAKDDGQGAQDVAQWLNSYDADLNQSLQDVGQAG